MKSFKKLGLSDATIEALIKKGFTKPTNIQEKTIPTLLKGEQDVIAQAQTGTGKTACFGLPILEDIEENKETQALILVPTRELALQVATEIDSLKGSRRIRVTAIYGGAPIMKQIDELRKGSNIVVGTPGRIIDLINRNKLKINNIKYAVLDEADEMLNMGFIEDIEKILSQTNENKKMLLFSATMPREILRIAKKFMKNETIIRDETKHLATTLIDQVYYDIMGKDRYTALKRLIAFTPDFHGLIFCKTRSEVDTVSNKLIKDEYAAAAIHGDISQGQRENTLRQFRDKNINILIATDVAARGIDVNDLNIVINYSLPQSPETYVHRIGRTGRAGKKGKAVTFLMPSEKNKLRFVEKILKESIPKGTLPGIDDIITAKKEHIETTIVELLQKEKKTDYDEIAVKLLNISEPKHVVAAVLSYAFANQLNSKNYQEVSKVTGYEKSSSRSRGGSRDRYRGGDRRGSSGGYKGGDRRSSNRRSRGGDRRGSSGGYKGGDRRSSNRGSRGGDRDGDYKPRGDSSSRGGFSRSSERSSNPRDSGRSREYKPREGGRERSSSPRDSGRNTNYKPRGDKPRYDKPQGDSGRSREYKPREGARERNSEFKPRGDSSRNKNPRDDAFKPRSYGGSNTAPNSKKKKDYSKKPRRDR